MKVFKGVTKSTNKAIITLIKTFGFLAKIYYPIAFPNKQHGHLDDDVTYNETPVEEKVLIPALFRQGNKTLMALDPFAGEDDTSLYAPTSVIYPKYSKIIIQVDGIPSSWIINEIKELRGDNPDEVVFRKYLLVPSTSIDLDRSKDELIDALNEELADPEFEEDLNPEKDLTSAVSRDSAVTFSPVKRG